MDRHLNHPAHALSIHSDEALIVHEGEEAHDELAIHAVRDTAVTRDGLAKVFDFEGAFEAGGEETAEGRDQGGEGREDEDVELHRGDVEGVGVEREEEGGECVGLRDEDGVGGAGEAGEDVCAEVLGECKPRQTSRWMLCWIRGEERRRLTLTGQMKYLDRISTLVMANPKTMVSIQAPTKPSTVFLGESLISWVRPNVMPQI